MIQNEVLKDIINKYRENKLAHAYLIETNNIDKAVKEIMELIKIINCPNTFESPCSKCNLCNLINKSNLPSIKIIEPDGTSIKKSQIEELKIEFSSIPLYSKYNCYIIKHAEKLNSSSANSMLKFVEEPESGIIGFFLTTNKDIILDTIKSRCAILNVFYESNTIIEKLNIDEETFQKYQNSIKKYLTKVYNSDIINNKKEILNEYPNRMDIENILKIILEIYYNAFLEKIGKNSILEIKQIYPINESLKKINKKIQIVSRILLNMSYNVNIELLLDKFVIEMRGTNE